MIFFELREMIVQPNKYCWHACCGFLWKQTHETRIYTKLKYMDTERLDELIDTNAVNYFSLCYFIFLKTYTIFCLFSLQVLGN